MNAVDLREGERYTFRGRVLVYAGHTGRTWYFEWGSRIIYCIHAYELKNLQPL